jgi:hypothetical protein
VKIPLEKEIEVILTEKIFRRIGEREGRVSTTLPTNLLSTDRLFLGSIPSSNLSKTCFLKP